MAQLLWETLTALQKVNRPPRLDAPARPRVRTWSSPRYSQQPELGTAHVSTQGQGGCKMGDIGRLLQCQ